MKNKYPKVNYIGNKEKITDWIIEYIPKDVTSVLDAFSGGCSLSYALKKKGFQVFTNDILTINYHIAKALIENNHITLEQNDLDTIFTGNSKEGFMFKNYSEVFYFADECKELDYYSESIKHLDNEYKQSLAYALVRRGMIRKMPYSRFTINWDRIKQLRDEEYSYKTYKRKRSYHNQSFKFHFEDNLNDYNNAVFDNKKENKAFNKDIFELLDSGISADLVYLDPPYAGTMNNYYGFYNLADEFILGQKKEEFSNNFMKKSEIIDLFDKLFSKLGNFKYWILSYSNTAYPTKDDIISLLSKYSTDITFVEKEHVYKVTGKEKKNDTNEYLFIVKNNKY